MQDEAIDLPNTVEVNFCHWLLLKVTSKVKVIGMSPVVKVCHLLLGNDVVVTYLWQVE